MPHLKSALILAILSAFGLQLSAFASDLFTIGGDFRLRDEYSDGVTSLNTDAALAEQNAIRLRARAWASLTAPKIPLSFNIRLSAEPRYFTEKSNAGTYRNKTGTEWRYAIFDTLNIRYENAFKLPLTLTVGRQDLGGVNKWLIGDGTPRDGSFTLFFDAVRAQWKFEKQKTNLDLVVLQQTAYPDDVLPVIGRTKNINYGDSVNARYSINEQKERGVILTLSNTSFENTLLEASFIYKHDDAKLVRGDDADIYTLTAKIAGQVAADWDYSIDLAYQLGSKKDAIRMGSVPQAARRDISAYAANARLGYNFDKTTKHKLSLIFEHLSGDRGDGHKDGMFDILWGRFPRFSEMAPMNFSEETNGRQGQYNNLQRLGLEWTKNLAPETNLLLIYNSLFAPQKTPTRAVAPAQFSGDSHFRGHFFRAVLTHNFTKQINAHILGEALFQGDYYTHSDTLLFARAQINYTW